MDKNTSIGLICRLLLIVGTMTASMACDSEKNPESEDTSTDHRGDLGSDDHEGCVEESDDCATDNSDSDDSAADNCDSDDCATDDCNSDDCVADDYNNTIVSPPEGIDPFDVLVAGNNTCYMVQAYFPKDILQEILPDRFTIPDDDTMMVHYPDTALKVNEHPFMMSFCHGSNIHDVLTMNVVPDQEELMFLFPVMYEHDNADMHLVSFLPVLYLDSETGVQGGLLYGLRKEFHPEMQNDEVSSTAGWWSIEGIIDASFETLSEEEAPDWGNFFEQTLKNPFATLSYPQPKAKRAFYQAKVYPRRIIKAREDVLWNHSGATITQGEDTCSVFAEYDFTMTWPMDGKTFFE